MSVASLWSGWRGLWRRRHLYDPGHDQAAAFRAQQMQAVLRLTPLAMGIQLICALLLPAVLWRQMPSAALLAWSAALAALAALGLRAWSHSSRQPPRPTATPRALRHVVMHALLLGVLWGLLPLLTYDLGDPESRHLVGILVTGMVCAGGFALAPVPVAATLLVLLVGAGATAGRMLHGGDFAPLLAVQIAGYMAIVIYAVWASARMMVARMLAEARASQQSEVISLLLRDFEDQATDVLWQLDEQVRFVQMSPRLVQALNLPAMPDGPQPALRVLRRQLCRDDEGRRR